MRLRGLVFVFFAGVTQLLPQSQQQTAPPAGGVYDQGEQVRRQDAENRRMNEEAAANFRPNPYAPKISRIEGRVVMPDGGPPPEPVRVEILGGSGPGASTFTDSKGRFSFTSGLTTGPASMGDIAMGRGGPAPVASALGGLVAVLPGFTCEPVQPNPLSSEHERRQYTLYLKPIAGVEGFTISMTSLSASPDARKAYDKGRDLILKKNPQQAEAAFRKAVALHPQYAAAWYQLGSALLDQNRKPEAIEALKRSLEADPKYINPYPALALIAYGEKRWEDVANYAGTLVRLNPYISAEVFFFSAVANFNLTRLDAAEAHARRAVEFDVRHQMPRASQILGLTLARRCKIDDAVKELNNYLGMAPDAADAAAVRDVISQISQPAYKAGCKPAATPGG